MRREAALWSLAAVLLLGSLSRAAEPQPYLGVSLDATPLPELLTKHLQLDPGQGLRIVNIAIGSPAEKAALDRDDILIAQQGSKVTSLRAFVETVRAAGVGTELSLEVIHLGQRKTVRVELTSEPDPQTVSWKYPREPEALPWWRPSRIFKIGPDGREMTEIPFDQFLEQKDLALEKLQEQVERLRQRIKEMEERNRQMLETLLPKDKTSDSAPPPASRPGVSPPKTPL